jgi:spore germination protein YaaH
MPLVEQELLILLEKMSSPKVLMAICSWGYSWKESEKENHGK